MKKNVFMGFWALVAGYAVIRMWFRYEDGEYVWAVVMTVTACFALNNFAQLNREDR